MTRDLVTPQQVSCFYQLFEARDFAFIVDEPVPRPLVEKYASLGLPEKADAFIGAFAEWMQVRCLVSDNRHFLRELHTDAYEILEPGGFLSRREVEIL